MLVLVTSFGNVINGDSMAVVTENLDFFPNGIISGVVIVVD